MIICHPLKLIFFKTKKTGGTSFEIALSSFCGPDCTITPITPEDEETRLQLGYRGAQNFAAARWPDGRPTDGVFYNHMPAVEARKLIPEDIWNSYRKVTIVRDPFDAMISRYYWEGGPATGFDFGQFVDAYRCFLGENEQIAPPQGPDAMDVYLKFEALSKQVDTLEIEGLSDRLAPLRAKAHHRPKEGTSRDALYGRFPKAIEIVKAQCGPMIAKFGYEAPPSAIPSPSLKTQSKFNYLFTVTAGRTATAWLAHLLAQNLDLPSLHEPLGIDDFGTRMPDIRVMRSFNTFGMDRNVQDFWAQKLSRLNAPLAESNHTLSKCGLVEALADSPIADQTALIVLRRNLVDQCVSYIMRGDFANITLEWQWYLSPAYRNNMVKPDLFLPLGQVGRALWYCLEMETRQAYYLQKFGHRLTFIEARLEDITAPEGARAFLTQLGYDGPVTLPERTNANQTDADTATALKEQITRMIEGLDFDPNAIARSYIESGRDLARPTVSRVA